ncbi:MAG: hypothetical protein WCA78_07380 [Rhizomicrobium sp.]|jgi:hypothetical protein
MSVQGHGDVKLRIGDEEARFWPDVSRRAILERDLHLRSANSPRQVLFEIGLIVAIVLALALAANLLIPGP